MRSRPKKSQHQTTHNWTDDLSVCKQTGVGSATNQIYREDGCREEEHQLEDKCFHCKIDDDLYFYGIVDGHFGTNVATFALQRMAAEVLLGQLGNKTRDEEIKEILRQAFISVEKGYMDLIDDLLAERTSLMCEIPENLTSYEAQQKFPNVMERLDQINYELSCGATIVIALIYRKKMYVANVGNSRALLCKTDSNSVLRVVQLTIDHDLRNEDELLRLEQLGINITNLKKAALIGNQENTRCIGNYLVKGGCKEFSELSDAKSDPVIAEPEITGGINIDDSCRFLILMTDGLYKSLEEVTRTPTDQVNKDIVQLICSQFRIESTLNGVAQAVVDKTVRLHHDAFNTPSILDNLATAPIIKRDDILLLIRNFNYPLPNAPINTITPISSPNDTTELNLLMRQMIKQQESPVNNEQMPMVSQSSPINSQKSKYDVERTIKNTDSNQDTINSDFSSRLNDTSSSSFMATDDEECNELNSNEKISAYVDFSEYYRLVEIAKKNGTLPDGIEFD